MRTPLAIVTLVSFIVTSLIGEMAPAYADEFHLPAPGVMVSLSPPLDPPILKGIKVHPDNPFKFDFILDKGDSSISSPNASVGDLQQEQLKTEATKLIKYFLVSLTIPEKDLWVNLSPYEKDRIIPNSFGLTEMGRDLLAEDYMLKQITASLIYPEGETGKKFWKRIYEEAEKKFGTTNIPVNTFNKVWIVPEKAVVYENAKAGTAYVVEAKLKVMLEQDYLALSKNSNNSLPLVGRVREGGDVNALGSQIVREIVIPELTKEVNEDKNFSKLRQVYNSLILATWYKKKIKDSILEQVYADKSKIAGVGYKNSLPLVGRVREGGDIEAIYQRYLRAFKKGVYNYIKEEIDPTTQEIIPRKYFSGGLVMDAAQIIDISPNISFIKTLKTAALILLTASLSFSGLRVNAQNTTHQASDTSFHKTLKTMATSLITDSLSFPGLGINALKADTSHMKKNIKSASLKKISISGLFYDTMVLRTTPDVDIKEVIKQAAIQNKFDFKINDEQMQELIKIFKKENLSYAGKFVQNQDYEVRDMVSRLRIMYVLSTSKVLAVSKLRNVTIYFIKNNIDDDTYDLPFSNNHNIVFINMQKTLDMDYVPRALDKEDAFMVKTYGSNSIDVIIKSLLESILGHEMNHGVMFKNITEHVYDSRLYADTIFREVLNPKPSDVTESETKLELAAMLWQIAYDEFPQHALRIAVINSLLKQDPHKYAAQIVSAAILDKLGFGAYFKEAIKGKDNFGPNVSKEKLMGIQNSETLPDYMQIRAAMGEGEDILDYVEDFLTSKSKQQPIISSDLNKTAKKYYERLFGKSLLSKDDVSKSLPGKIVQEAIEDYLYSSNSSRDAPLRFYSNGPLLKVKVGIKDGKPQKIDEILKEYKHQIDTNDMVYLDLLVRHSNPNLKYDIHFDPSEPGEMIDLTAVKAFLDGKVSITHELGLNMTNLLSQLHKSNANMKLLRNKLKVGQDTDQVRDAISKETRNSLQLFKNIDRSLSKNNLITNRTVTGDFEDGPIEELDDLNSYGITKGNERFGKKSSSAELMDQIESVLDSEDESIGILRTFLKYEWIKKAVKEAVKGVGKHTVTIKNNAHKNGGIDFNAVNKVLESQSQAGNAIKFHIDPAILAQLQSAPGFVPVIINMQPLKSLEKFLGIDQTSSSPMI